MEFLIWIGAAISLGGLAGIVACGIAVARAKRHHLEDAELRNRLQKFVVWNLGALLVSSVGLMLVVVGVILS